MMFLLLILPVLPSQGVRELLVPVAPQEAIFSEALVASRQPVSFYFNPALAVRESYPCFHVSHTEWFAGTRRERVDALLPFTWGTLGIGANGFHVWDLEHRESPDDPAELFSAYNTGLDLRYARSLGRFMLGVEAGMFLQHIYTYSAGGFYGSLGGAYNLKHFSFGLSLLDLGPPVRLLTESTQLPTRVEAGASWIPIEALEVETGISYAFDGSFNASAGIDARVLKILHIQIGGGYGTVPRVGLGAMLELKYLRIGYAASLRPGIGLSHHIGVNVVLVPSEREDPLLLTMMQTSNTFVENGKRDMLNRDYKHALEQFDLALVWYPDNEEAKQGYEEALAKERELQISLHLEKARQYRESEEYLDALREYEFVLSLAPDNALAISGRTDMLLEMEQMPLLAGQDIPDEASQLFQAGVEAFRADRFKEALSYWKELEERFAYLEEIRPFIDLASQRRDEQIDSLLLAAYAARERDALPQALKLAEEVLRIDPTEGRAHTLREELRTLMHRRSSELLSEALSYFDSRRYDLAAQKFNDVLSIDPTDPTAKRYLERLQKEEKLKREDLEQLNIAATNAYALGDYDTAIRIWEQILAVDSTFANIQRNLERARRKLVLLGNP